MKLNIVKNTTTLKMILLKAIYEIDKTFEVEIHNTLSHGLFGIIKNKEEINEKEILEIKSHMDEIIRRNSEIIVLENNLDLIRKKSKTILRKDIIGIVNSAGWSSIKEYDLEGYTDYFYNEPYRHTGEVKNYDLIGYSNGFVLQFPIEEFSEKIPVFQKFNHLTSVQKETAEWNSIMDVSYIGSLNEKTMNGGIREVIRLNETLHEIKLSKIADKIIANPDIKLVTIAGPSSSGKTTFAQRLTLHLKANKKFPLMISLDDYYIGRVNIPLDEKGDKDFESLYALDLELLNRNFRDLLNGKEVEVPQYDFVSGERKPKGKLLKMPENGILMVEGIHGLNEEISKNIKKTEKLKIYISCLTQLNIDMHNRIPTNEVRKIRRIVRDSLSRGIVAEETLAMWNSVRCGEEKNIFKYQEEADVIFDSNLVYELGVLKKYALKELIRIKYDSPYYEKAKELIQFLYCFIDIEDKYVPEISILKEFIGGSYFYRY